MTSETTARVEGRRLLIVDLGNVLIDVHFSRFVARHARPGADVAALGRLLAEHPVKLEHDRGRAEAQDVWRVAMEVLQAPDLSPEAFEASWPEIFDRRPDADAFFAAPPPDTDFWLLSDTDPLHYGWAVRNLPALTRFSRCLVSYERGCLKRDPGSFAELVAATRSWDRVLFVDDLPLNIFAAESAGMPSHLFTGWAQVAEIWSKSRFDG